MRAPYLEGAPCELINVLDNTHRGYRIHAKVRPDNKRLALVIADDADAALAVHLRYVVFKLGPELRVSDVMNKPRVGGAVPDSKPSGQHAKWSNLCKIVEALSSMGLFEVAIGGGATMSYPRIGSLLHMCHSQGVIPNITVADTSWVADTHLLEMVEDTVGVVAFSVKDVTDCRQVVCDFGVDRIGFQVIDGVVSRREFKAILEYGIERSIPVTLLGFKATGRGSHYVRQQTQWADVIREIGRVPHTDFYYAIPGLSIDTALALEYEEELKSLHIPRQMYHTTEGKFSMYIDAVNMQCAASSYASDMKPLRSGEALVDQIKRMFAEM